MDPLTGAFSVAAPAGAGTYTVSVSATDSNGNVSLSGGTATETVVVAAPAVVAHNDAATVAEGHWTAVNTTVSTEVTTPESWSSSRSTQSIGANVSVDPSAGNKDSSYNGVAQQAASSSFTVTANSGHSATVKFDVQMSGFQSNDVVKVELIDASGQVVGTKNYTTNSDQNGSFTVNASGTYQVRVYADDNSKNGDLKASVKNLQYESYSYTPAETHTVTTNETSFVWQDGDVATGSITANDDNAGSALVTMVNGTPIAATGNTDIVGDYGILSINANGEYTYTPNATDNLAGVQEAFDYTLDGGATSATLTVSFTDHVYSSSADDQANLVGGGDSDDTLSGLGGNDFVYGGAGNDNLSGGDGNDTLTGGADNDVFAWTLADRGTAGHAAVDTITDFKQGDSLDLRNLLDGGEGDEDGYEGDEDATGNLLDYISVEKVGNDTVLHISSEGKFDDGEYKSSKEDQTIVLKDVDLTVQENGHVDQTATLLKMLQNGNLNTNMD
ncbi:MAG: type I secretion C-terminal target domain-containing protein [Nitrosomonadales bacterium]|nr:type I secretion C-terminal target domain-containing protein [Nitrosomonadales bacterium]